MTANAVEKKVKNFSVLTRAAVLIVQALSNIIIPDHEAEAFTSPSDPDLPTLWGDKVVNLFLGGLLRWDAQYFVHIAQYGYTHENTLAFFPLFPLAVRCFAIIINIPLQFVCNFHSSLLISATVLNFYIFVKTSVIFFRLSREVLKNELLAYRASLLFCINPASIFFTAPYSEALFAFLAFYAQLLNETKNSTLAAIPFGLAAAARSNGLVNIGFILYRKLQDCSDYYYKLRHARTEDGRLSFPLVALLTFNYTLLPLFVGTCMVLTPFAIFQFWSYLTYCSEEGHAAALPDHLELFVRSNFLHSPDLGEADWCYNFPPLAYTYVQDKFWEVGLFRYYELRQVPNFLLALPVVLLIISHAALYIVDNPQVCWSLGIPQPALVEAESKDKSNRFWKKEGISSWRVFVYTAHSLLLCLFCVLCIHVQVTTRLLCSSSPVVYWFAAYVITETSSKKCESSVSPRESRSTKEGWKSKDDGSVKKTESSNGRHSFMMPGFSEFPRNFWGQVILSYFLLYFMLGTILYSNFFPWT